MAPDLNKKLEDEVEKYRQTQNGKSFLHQRKQINQRDLIRFRLN